MNIVLIGYRGTGKTTVARTLASHLNWDWIDSDLQVERLADKTIAGIFEENGETVFRDLETQVVARLAAEADKVLALGGGAFLRAENRRAVAGCGKVIWLKAAAATIHARISADKTSGDRRPSLTSAGRLGEISQLLDVRTPIYRQCADYIVDTEGKTPDQVANEILGLLRLDSSPDSPA